MPAREPKGQISPFTFERRLAQHVEDMRAEFGASIAATRQQLELVIEQKIIAFMRGESMSSVKARELPTQAPPGLRGKMSATPLVHGLIERAGVAQVTVAARKMFPDILIELQRLAETYLPVGASNPVDVLRRLGEMLEQQRWAAASAREVEMFGLSALELIEIGVLGATATLIAASVEGSESMERARDLQVMARNIARAEWDRLRERAAQGRGAPKGPEVGAHEPDELETPLEQASEKEGEET